MTRAASKSYMTAREYVDTLRILGLRRAAGASFLHVDRSTHTRRIAGAAPIDAATTMLLRTMIRYRLKPTGIPKVAAVPARLRGRPQDMDDRIARLLEDGGPER